MGPRHSCAFTSGASTGSGVSSADCTRRSGENALLKCRFCDVQPVYRCSGCYAKFSSTIKRRLGELEVHHSAETRREPAIDAFLEIDWATLARTGVCEHHSLEYVEPGLFAWRIPCPSCYDFVVDPVEPMAPADFHEQEPAIVGDEILALRAPRLDRTTGLVAGEREVSMRVLSVDGVLTREQEKQLMYRAADPPVHDKYHVLWQPHPALNNDVERWLLVRSTGWGGDEAKAMSLIRWNALRGCAERTSDHELGAAMLDCVRRAAGFHVRQSEKASGKARRESAAQKNKKPENVMQGPTPSSSIRVNRVSGPFGHLAAGTRFSTARAQVRVLATLPCNAGPLCVSCLQLNPSAPQVCDPLVTGAIPRRAGAAICVPLETAGKAITAIVPFYMSDKGGLNARAVTPRHHAIPRLGWVGKGKRLSAAIREHSLAPQLLKLMRTFTCTTYDGALLLRALATARPDLAASEVAVNTTLSNYNSHLLSFSSPQSVARTATRSLSITPYSKVCKQGLG